MAVQTSPIADEPLEPFDNAVAAELPMEAHPDVALVEQAKAGDTAAFEQLVRQYERQIFRTALHITQNREDAEDITQDVFFKAFQKLDQFQGNSKFSTWLVRIAVKEGRETRPDLKIGICGEHGGDPDSVHFCHEVGLDYVSCSPFRIPVARLEAGRAALETAGSDTR